MFDAEHRYTEIGSKPSFVLIIPNTHRMRYKTEEIFIPIR